MDEGRSPVDLQITNNISTDFFGAEKDIIYEVQWSVCVLLYLEFSWRLFLP